MGLAGLLRESIAPAVNLVYPPRCPLCGDGIEAQSGLCGACWMTLAIPGHPACAGCQLPLPGHMDEGAWCAPCLAKPPRHGGIATATIYNEASRKLVLAFKHGGRIALAPMLARLIAGRLPQEVDRDWLVVPVPLHRWRLWRRGYNQAAILAAELAKLTGAGVAPDILLRTRATRPLGGLGRVARARTLAGAIKVDIRQRDAVKGRSVLLVDDVLTSGATSDTCVAALLRAGAARVVIACFARVVDEHMTGMSDPAKNETPGIQDPGRHVTKL